MAQRETRKRKRVGGELDGDGDDSNALVIDEQERKKRRQEVRISCASSVGSAAEWEGGLSEGEALPWHGRPRRLWKHQPGTPTTAKRTPWHMDIASLGHVQTATPPWRS